MSFWGQSLIFHIYSKTCLKWPLKKKTKIVFKDRLLLNDSQKNSRMLPLWMLPLEHSAILLTFIKLPLAIKTLVLSVFEWPFYTGFTVIANYLHGISIIIAHYK